MAHSKNWSYFTPAQMASFREEMREQYTGNLRLMRSELATIFADRQRNIEAECGYPDSGDLTPEAYYRLWERDAIASRVVDLYPTECWQICPEVYEDEDEEITTPFEEAFDSVGRAVNNIGGYEGAEGNPIWNYLERLDILSGIGRYGVMLIGVDDGAVDLAQPLKLAELTYEARTEEVATLAPGGETRREQRTTLNLAPAQPPGTEKAKEPTRKLLYLRVLDQTHAPIVGWDTNPASPRFGKPEFYNITISGQESTMEGVNQTETSTTKRVHWSRLIHVADNLESSEVLGTPRCQRVYNRLYDLHKLYGGSAEMYYQGAFPGISFETQPAFAGVKISDTQKRDIRESMHRRRTGLQRDLVLPGLSANSLAPQVVDPSPQIERQLEAICIQLGCPKRKFMGTERGELASTQDGDDWYGRLRKRLNRHVTPSLVVTFVNRLIQIGILPAPEKYCVHWPDLKSASDVEKAQIALTRTQALAAYIQGGCEAAVTPLDYHIYYEGFPPDIAKQMNENKMADLEDEETLDIHAREDEIKEEEAEHAEQLRQEDLERADGSSETEATFRQQELDIAAKAVAAKAVPPKKA